MHLVHRDRRWRILTGNAGGAFNEEVSGLRPALKDAVRDTAWRGALPRAAIRSWFTCPGRASYLVKAAYPVVITAIIWSTAKAVASSKFHGTEPPRSDMEAIIEA